jgi:hypothetical protein
MLVDQMSHDLENAQPLAVGMQIQRDLYMQQLPENSGRGFYGFLRFYSASSRSACFRDPIMVLGSHLGMLLISGWAFCYDGRG